MCGRYQLTSPVSTISHEFGLLAASVRITTGYNISPSRNVAVVIIGEAGRVVHSCRWGFIPSWAKDPSVGHHAFNARAETVAVRPVFRSAFRKHRCLILADGFYEWRHLGTEKTPFYIRLRTGRPFGFAGLYSHWAPAEGKTLCTCAIITTSANELVGQIHERMPVIIPKDQEDRWLDPELQDPKEIQAMLSQYPASEMEMYEVSARVNSPAFDGPEAIQPV